MKLRLLFIISLIAALGLLFGAISLFAEEDSEEEDSEGDQKPCEKKPIPGSGSVLDQIDKAVKDEVDNAAKVVKAVGREAKAGHKDPEDQDCEVVVNECAKKNNRDGQATVNEGGEPDGLIDSAEKSFKDGVNDVEEFIDEEPHCNKDIAPTDNGQDDSSTDSEED